MSKEPSQRPARTSANGSDPARAWQSIQEHLESVKIKVLKEIEHYPSPITACDAQFNYLLERRDGVSEELRILDAVRAESASPEERVEAAQRFLRSSRFIDAKAAATLCAPAPSGKPVR